MLTHRTRAAYVLAIVTIVAAACRDDATPTSPRAARPSGALLAAPSKPRPRVPYISNLQVPPVVSMTGATPYTVTVTNPGPKDVQTIYLKSELDSDNNYPPINSGEYIAHCPAANGVVPRGDCTMAATMTGGAYLAPGGGTFTLRLVQKLPDGTETVLDTKVVEVVLSQYY